MNDTVRRFLFDDLDIRGAVVRLDTVWQKLMTGRDYPAPVVHLLGQMSVIAVLLADNLKQARLTLQMRGSGPVSRLVVDCNESLNLRCMAHYAKGLVAAPLSDLLGDGQLVLTLDTPENNGLYQSQVPIEGKTVAEIFEHYLQRSEQLDSRFFLVATSTHATGLYLQKMPTNDRDPDGWARVSALAATVKPEELTGLSDEKLLTRLFHEENVRLFDARAVSSDFSPDPGKMANILLTLGREEVYDNLDRNGDLILIHDELSNYEYRFTREEIDALFIHSPEVSKSVH